jgi:hypothetical protein
MLQPRTPLEHPRVLAAFAAASDAYLRTLREVREWEAPGLGEWTVRELVAHALRSYTTIETYLDAEPSADHVIDNATAYYREVLATPGIHAAAAARGRDAGQALTDPLVQVPEVSARVLARIAGTQPDRRVETFAGRMVFTEYLATRVIELGLHTADLQVAIGAAAAIPADATALCLDVLMPLADDLDLLLGITGRKRLNVLG